MKNFNYSSIFLSLILFAAISFLTGRVTNDTKFENLFPGKILRFSKIFSEKSIKDNSRNVISQKVFHYMLPARFAVFLLPVAGCRFAGCRLPVAGYLVNSQ